jgi:hypothetical protein
MMRGFLGGIALALAVVVSGTARTHEFIVKPAAMTKGFLGCEPDI